MYYLFCLYVLWIDFYVRPRLVDIGAHSIHICCQSVFSANGLGVVLCEIQMPNAIDTAASTEYFIEPLIQRNVCQWLSVRIEQQMIGPFWD